MWQAEGDPLQGTDRTTPKGSCLLKSNGYVKYYIWCLKVTCSHLSSLINMSCKQSCVRVSRCLGSAVLILKQTVVLKIHSGDGTWKKRLSIHRISVAFNGVSFSCLPFLSLVSVFFVSASHQALAKHYVLCVKKMRKKVIMFVVRWGDAKAAA